MSGGLVLVSFVLFPGAFWMMGRFAPVIAAWTLLLIGTLILVDYIWAPSFLGVSYSEEMTRSGVNASELDEFVEGGVIGLPLLGASVVGWCWGRILKRRTSDET